MAEPEATGDEAPPPHVCTLAFSFEFTEAEPPEPPEQPPEEEPPAPSILNRFQPQMAEGAKDKLKWLNR